MLPTKRITSWLKRRVSKPVRNRRQRLRRVNVSEGLEERLLLAAFNVTNLNDSGTGSLRQAVADANNTAGADDINFDVTGTLTLTSGQLNVTDSAKFNGPGADQLIISGNNASRVFQLGTSGGGKRFEIFDVTIANGSEDTSEGGGIRMVDAGDILELHRSTIRDNHANGAGGLNLTGTFQIMDSAIINNTANFSGPAMQIGGDGTNGWINNTTVSGNASSSGSAAIEQTAGVGDTTAARLRKVTIANNTGWGIGGFAFDGGTLTFEVSNTIFAGNSDQNISSGQLGSGVSTIVSRGGNISDEASPELNNGDLVNTDPLIAPLSDNGGPTLTHALLTGSPAIDAGLNARAIDSSATPFPFDQRGNDFRRLVDADGNGTATVDIGSYEAAARVVVDGELAPNVSGDIAVVEESVVFQVAAAEGLLQNDPLGAIVTGFDATSTLGAAVQVTPAGGFTYDTTTVPALSTDIPPFQFVSDSFTYTIGFGGQTATVLVRLVVTGKGGPNDIMLQTDEDTLIPQKAGETLLANATGANPRVVSFDAVSSLGATVVVEPNGEYSYDPTTSSELQSLIAGDPQIDTFTFERETDSSVPEEITVQIRVTGTNDDPDAPDVMLNDFADTAISPKPFRTELDGTVTDEILDQGEIFSDTAFRISLSSLFSDPDLGDTHTVTIDNAATFADVSLEVVQGRGGSPDEYFVLFDATETEYYLELPFLTDVADSFGYTVTDNNGATASGTLTVELLSGERHAPVAVDDVYPLPGAGPVLAGEVSRFLANPDGLPEPDPAKNVSLLRNDGVDVTDPFPADFDGDQIVVLEGLDQFGDWRQRTALGAEVLFFQDGTFYYNAATSATLDALPDGQTIVDTFTYHVDDEFGDGKSLNRISEATVRITVTGVPQRQTFTFDVPAGTDVELVSQPNASPARNVIHELGNPGNILWQQPYSLTSRIVINGSNSAEVIDATAFSGRGTALLDGFRRISLTINGGGGNDDIRGGGSSETLNGGAGNDTITGDPGDDVIDGGDGNDVLHGEEGSDLVNGRRGNDELFGDQPGGSAQDQLNGGDGNDTLTGGGGPDFLYGNAGTDRFTDLSPDDQSDNNPNEDFVVAPLNFSPSIADLATMGSGPRITLNSAQQVSITGRSGYGFNVGGSWVRTALGNGGERFTGTNVVITTEIGPDAATRGLIPIPILQLDTLPDSVQDTGVLTNFTPFSLIPGGNTAFAAISQFSGFDLVSATLPQFGLKLGSQLLANEFAGSGAPLNNAIPYLFFKSSDGDPGLNFGGVSLSVLTGSNPLLFAIDPFDTSIWVKVGDFSVGYSHSGYFPFEALATPSAITGQQVFGNFYGSGLFSVNNFEID